jgi:signal transduction histidine kinase
MFGNLRTQLLLSSIAALALLLMGTWASTHALMNWATAIYIAVCVYVLAINIWFWCCVAGPLEKLREFSKRISNGSYGIKTEEFEEDEIGYLAEEINNISEKTALAEKTRTEFISQVSHELRTPLTAITGWAETIAYDPAVQGDSLKGIQIISKEAERLTNMVKELLEFTRIQDGRFNLRIELIDIAAELEDALFTYGELMKQAGMEVKYNGPPGEIPLIPGDPERLKQVFLNLLDNAMKHGGDGGRIDVSLRQEENWVRINVRDYGHGIPEAELPHVKEKFYKGSSKNRGTGIGLAVCDEIVTRHGGELSIENAEGGGCRVTILLPQQNGETNGK